MAKAKVQAMIRQYQTLFPLDLNPTKIEAMKISIRKILLADDHQDALELGKSNYTKEFLGNCFLLAEKGAFTKYIAQNKIEEIKTIIQIFNSFNDPQITKIQLSLLRDAIRDTTSTLRQEDIRDPLHLAIVELFNHEAHSHPEITGFESLYQETLSIISVEC